MPVQASQGDACLKVVEEGGDAWARTCTWSSKRPEGVVRLKVRAGALVLGAGAGPGLGNVAMG